MPSVINSDNGAVSGTAGLKTSGASDGITVFQQNGTERMRIDSAGRVGIAFVPLSSTGANGDLLQIGSPTATVGSGLTIGSTTTGDIQFSDATSGTGQYAGLIRYSHSDNSLALWTASSERMRIDSAGNLGLGVTPSAWASGRKVLQVSNGSGGAYLVSGSATQALLGANGYSDGATFRYAANGTATLFDQGNGAFTWYTAPSGTAGNAITFTQAMTLDASGNLLVGSTNASASAGLGAKVIANANGAYFASVTDSTTNGAHTTYNYYSTGAGNYRFYVGAAGTVFAVSTTISGISDQRLKENIQDIDVGLDKIMALKPRKFDWKPGKGKDKKGDRGWIAQEFEQVFPEMIDTWKDPAPEGEEPYKAVNADLIPVLVKAIQELKAELDSVKAELAALKA